MDAMHPSIKGHIKSRGSAVAVALCSALTQSSSYLLAKTQFVSLFFSFFPQICPDASFYDVGDDDHSCTHGGMTQAGVAAAGGGGGGGGGCSSKHVPSYQFPSRHHRGMASSLEALE